MVLRPARGTGEWDPNRRVGLCGHFGSEPQRDDDERLLPISADDQEIVAVEPIIEPAKSAAATFDFHPAITSEQRHGEITAETTAGRPGKRNTFGGKTTILKEANQRPLAAISLLPGGATATLLRGKVPL
jgi:hypothetical protein